MAALRDIKQRIRSVREIQKITRAMKMVATSKLRKVQRNQKEFETFRWRVDNLFWRMANEVENRNHPFIQRRKDGSFWIIVLTSDRGLCGSYNHNIEREVEKFVGDLGAREVSLLISGRKGWNYFRRKGYSVVSLDLPEETAKRARVFACLVTHSFLSGEVDRLYVISDSFSLTRERGVQPIQLLPLLREEEDCKEKKPRKNEVACRPEKKITSYLLEPTLDSVFERLCRLYILNRLYQLFLDSEAAEQLTRMTAMDMATSNADNLIFELTLSYNKARQEAITNELIDILGGSGAISI